MTGPAHNSRTSEQGSALVVVLWVVGLLSMFVMAFAFDMHIEARITSTWRRKLQAEYLARAGVELARMTLLAMDDPELQTTEPGLYISMGPDEEQRAATLALARGGGAELERALGNGLIRISLRPENARINIHTMIDLEDRELTYDQMTPLFDSAGIPWEMRDELVDCLLDWVDEDELVRLAGAESSYYESLDPPYEAKNRPLDTIEEIFLIKGFDQIVPETDTTVYETLAGFLTTYSEDQKININAADLATLMAFLNIDEQMAQQIIDERAGPDGIEGTADDDPFTQENLTSRLPILSEEALKYIAFNAVGRFNIRVQGQVGDVTRNINCIVSKDEQVLLILNWTENDTGWSPRQGVGHDD
ncbi:MAG: general secretion pathway protein GspK [Kiritimatiellia bacterium]